MKNFIQSIFLDYIEYYNIIVDNAFLEKKKKHHKSGEIILELYKLIWVRKHSTWAFEEMCNDFLKY